MSEARADLPPGLLAAQPPPSLLIPGLRPPAAAVPDMADTRTDQDLKVPLGARPPDPAPPDRYLSPAGAAASPDPHSAGLDAFVRRNMELEGYGKDPNSSAVSGFMPDTWLGVAQGEPETQGKSRDQILNMRYDHGPIGEAFRARMTAKLAAQNGQALASSGVPVNNGTLRLADWLGAGAAVKVAAADPNTPLESIVGPAVIRANSELAGLTAGQMMQMTAQQMDGKNPFAGRATGLDVMRQLSADERQNTATSIAQLERDRAAILAEASGAPAGSAERMRMLHEAHEHAHELTKLYEDKIRNPPTKKPADVFAGWGGIAIALAALAGSRSAQPLTASLNAMSGAMDAMNQGNDRDYEDRIKIWDKQSGFALKAIEIQNQEIREILEAQHISEAERQARLSTLYHVAGMDQQIALQRSGQIRDERSNLYQMLNLEEQYRVHDEHVREFNKTYERLKERTPAQQQYIDREMAQLPPGATDAEKNAKMLEAERKWKAASSGTSELTPAAVAYNVDMYIAGDTAVITALPRSGPARIQVENGIAEKLRGMDEGARTVMLNRMRMAEARSAATTAGRVTINTELYAQEAAGAATIVVNASKAFSRTNYPRINQALAAYETNVGDPQIIEFGTAINALLNAYGKMSNPTGTGIHDADKERLQKILDVSLSQGQVEGAVAMIIREGRNVSAAAQRAQEEIIQRLVPQGGAPGMPPPPAGSPSAGTTIRYDAQGNRVP